MKTTKFSIFFNVNILVFSQFSRDFSHLTWVPWGVWTQPPGPHIGPYLLVRVTDGRISLLFTSVWQFSKQIENHRALLHVQYGKWQWLSPAPPPCTALIPAPPWALRIPCKRKKSWSYSKYYMLEILGPSRPGLQLEVLWAYWLQAVCLNCSGVWPPSIWQASALDGENLMCTISTNKRTKQFQE